MAAVTVGKKVYTIYKATNKVNGKVYIGFDSDWPNRMLTHRYMVNAKPYKFYYAIRKYGWESFEWEVLHQESDGDHCLKVMEPYFIAKYDSYASGYNMTLGGDGTWGYKKSPEEVARMSARSSKRSSESRWYNNGTVNSFCRKNPGDGWALGRLNQKPTNKGLRQFTNGKSIIFADRAPDESWRPGRPAISQYTKAMMAIGRRRPVRTPHGDFLSARLASEETGVKKYLIDRKVRRKVDGYRRMQKYIIVSDMDGVLCDFVGGALRAHGRSETHDSIDTWNFYEKWGMTLEEFLEPCRSVEFWENLEPYPWAVEMLERISKNFVVFIATAPPDCVEAAGACAVGKYRWLKKHTGIDPGHVMIGARKHLLADPLKILIDDGAHNLVKFQEHGGLAIGFKQPWNKFEHNWEDVLKELDNYVTA